MYTKFMNATNRSQQTSLALPFAGPGLIIFGSYTYYMAIMIGTYDYYLFTKDDAFLSANWAKYQLAMIFIPAKIDSKGCLMLPGQMIGVDLRRAVTIMKLTCCCTKSSSLEAVWPLG
jgi:hypothetical protein